MAAQDEKKHDWIVLNACDGTPLDRERVWPVWTGDMTREEIKVALLTIARRNPGFLVTAVPMPDLDESLVIQWSKERRCYVDRLAEPIDVGES